MKTIMRTIAIMATMWCVVSINVHGQTYQPFRDIENAQRLGLWMQINWDM